MWPSGLTLDMTLTLNFQGQIWNWLYICQKWSDCHKTKSKHIDWTLGLKCDHQIWPWLWPWPWIFKVKYEFLYIGTKTGPIATERKANILIWTLGLKYDQWVWPWPWPWINIWILKVICDLGHLVTKVRCKDLPDNDWGDFRCRCAVDSSSYTWWHHQMETFSALLALCAGNSPVPVNSPHKGQWRGSLMFSLIYSWIKDWVNNREAGDLRRHRDHYDVIVMICSISIHRWLLKETSLVVNHISKAY